MGGIKDSAVHGSEVISPTSPSSTYIANRRVRTPMVRGDMSTVTPRACNHTHSFEAMGVCISLFHEDSSLGLLLGLEGPVMTPNGVTFLSFLDPIRADTP